MAGSNVVSATLDAPSGGIDRTVFDSVKRLVLLRDNACLAAAGTAAATTASKVKTVNTVTYLIDGQFKSLAGTDNFWTLTGTTLTAGQSNKWLLCVDGSGTASVVEGILASTVAGVTFADVTGSDGHIYPSPGPSKCVVGQLTVTCNSSTFVPGTTLLSAGTITVVYRDGYEALATGPQFPAPYGK